MSDENSKSRTDKISDFILRNYTTLVVILIAAVFGAIAAFIQANVDVVAHMIFWLLLGFTISELHLREVRLNEIDKTTKKTVSHMDRLVSQVIDAQYIDNEDEIISKFQRLTEDISDSIVGIVFGGRNSPSELTTILADAVKEQVSKKNKAVFRPTIVVDYKNPSTDVHSLIESKIKLYEDREIPDNIRIHVLDQSPDTGTDIVVIDDKHVVFLLSDPRADPKDRENIYHALVFENEEKVAKTFEKWIFRNFYDKGKPYKDEKNKITRTQYTSSTNQYIQTSDGSIKPIE